MTKMNVPMIDIKRDSAETKQRYRDALLKTLDQGSFILGPDVEALEKECAAYLGVKYALGISSGTDALVIALMALGIGAGDEVICPTFTFFATAGSVARVGATPVFIDSSACCYNVSITDLEKKITKKTKAIIPVHLYGQSADMDPLMELAKKHNIPVIEDVAQAFGAEYRGRKCGSIGDIGCFSFYPTKNLGGFGDSGLVTTNSEELYNKLKKLRVHGSGHTYHHEMVGGNFRMDGFQGALLRIKLETIDSAIAKRNVNADIYHQIFNASDKAQFPVNNCTCMKFVRDEEIIKPILLPYTCDTHTFNQYVIRVPKKRDALKQHLADHGIGSAVFYPIALHNQQCFQYLGGKPGDCPLAEKFCDEVLALPIFPELRKEEVEYVAETVVSFFKK
jgi:dTDP-4-amino-4,6-dideoxygalactose transaminase